MFELMAEEPEAPAGLQMVARRGLAVAPLVACEEVRARVLERRPRREQARRDVERYGEADKPRAAASSSSKSGSSEVP